MFRLYNFYYHHEGTNMTYDQRVNVYEPQYRPQEPSVVIQ